MTKRLFRKRDEEGATLILVIGFMLMVGLVSAGLATQLASTSKSRVALDTARNRQYAADGAILEYIPIVRSQMESSPLGPCPGTHSFRSPGPRLNGVDIQVDCDFPGIGFTLSGFVQRNVKFTACAPQPGNAPCPSDAVIIQAQVNYASQDPPAATSIDVTRTYIQTWNVKS
jgi:hypothetical protein